MKRDEVMTAHFPRKKHIIQINELYLHFNVRINVYF